MEEQEIKDLIKEEIEKVPKPVIPLKSSQLDFPLDPATKRIIRNSIIIPVSTKVPGTDAATAANYGKFFVADKLYRVVGISEVHGVKGSDGGNVTLNIERLQGTEALGSGDALLSTAFDLKGTADTPQHGALTNTGESLILNRGDRLALKDGGTLTAVADVAVTVFLQMI
jgi:hypothetical protein